MTTPINRNPADLYPPFAKSVSAHHWAWNVVNKKESIQVFEGLRSFDRQAELYAQGRTTPGNPCVHKTPSFPNGVLFPIGTCKDHPLGKKVTNAPAGFSWHQYGVAVDSVFDADPIKPDLQASWDGKFPWFAMGRKGIEIGLEWAGTWDTFPEFPHFQKTWGMQITEAHALFEIGGLPAVWNALDLTRQVLSRTPRATQ